jgi:hypothetical protein
MADGSSQWAFGNDHILAHRCRERGPSTPSGQSQQIDARRLHSFLESRQEFPNWIKDRIASYGFDEDHDLVAGQFEILWNGFLAVAQMA